MPVNYQMLRQFRRQLHSQPELSGMEQRTSEKIIGLLESCRPDEILTGVGGFGIVSTWDSGKEGDEIVFRSELDALPIEEINEFEHRSVNKGVSHKCGHDGHSAILCGVAQYLSENKPVKGKVRLLFQPSEENGEGAEAVFKDERFNHIKPSFIFAIHNLPGYPLNQVVIKENSFTAAVSSIIINLFGKTSHAAEPEHGINPALAVSEILRKSIMLENNDPEKPDMKVITPVYAELGEKAYGVSAGEASIHLTLRCWNDDNLQKLEKKIEDISKRVAKKHKLKTDFEYTQIFRANVNDADATEKVRKAALDNGYALTERKYPFKWGEDFGLFTSHFKGCMFGLGAGENAAALHNPDYDFPDELIETGVNIFAGIVSGM